VNIPFPSVEMIDYLAENFRIRFNDFRSRDTNLRVFGNPFSLEVSDAPEKLQFELIELQYDSFMRNSFNQEALTFLHASLPVSRFSELRKLAHNLASAFGSTHVNRLSHKKLKFCSRITDVNSISKMEPNLNSLSKQTQAKFSH
jgi:hypothetical protein